VSIILGFLLKSAITATVQIQQANGPLEVRLVDFPGVYGELMDEKKDLEEEKENLLAVIADEQALLAFAPPLAVAPTIPTTEGDSLFALYWKNGRNWQPNHGEPRDGREATFNPKNFVVVGRDGYAEYIIEKDYSTLIGTIASHFEMANNECVITIWANDRQIYKSPIIKNTSKAITFSASLEGIEGDVIKIHSSNGPVLLMDFELHSPKTPKATQTQLVPGTPLFTMQFKNEERWWVNAGEPKDGRGKVHNPKNFVLTGENYYGRGLRGYAEYVINNDYKRLTGTIAPYFTMENYESVLTIWANERQIYKSPVIKNTNKPIEFVASLEGLDVESIKIEAIGFLVLMDFELS